MAEGGEVTDGQGGAVGAVGADPVEVGRGVAGQGGALHQDGGHLALHEPLLLPVLGDAAEPAGRHQQPWGTARDQVFRLYGVLGVDIAGDAEDQPSALGADGLAGTAHDAGEDVVRGRHDHSDHGAFGGLRPRLGGGGGVARPDHRPVQPLHQALRRQGLHVAPQRDRLRALSSPIAPLPLH
ncbi:hypothetical protein [Streptomyces sp. NPDC001410]|uniref:hypothetical protein n=1 Tax=Streptomyces sp. NPDC001410 TaxID=3364574 RepID=UPI0036B6B354